MSSEGRVVWITGLSGAGKSTIAKALVADLQPRCILLDGDAMREVLGRQDGSYSKRGRMEVAFTYSRLCRLLAEQGFGVVCATISLYHSVRKWNRENLPGYMEVFVDVSDAVRRQRDPKKLYYYQQAQKLDNLAGVDCPVELPDRPDLIIGEHVSVDMAVSMIKVKLTELSDAVS